MIFDAVTGTTALLTTVLTVTVRTDDHYVDDRFADETHILVMDYYHKMAFERC